MMVLIRKRFCYSDQGTFSVMELGGTVFYFCEPPWRENRKNESCIPEGYYTLIQRESPVVQRSSGGEFEWGWMIEGVPNREFIMFHVGNTIDDSDGCPLVGAELGCVYGKWAVQHSRVAFRRFQLLMNEMRPTHHVVTNSFGASLYGDYNG